MTSHNFILRPLPLLIAVICLAACQPALIYGERTSFNLAAIQLNDDVIEPVKIKIGLFRSVATVAPPRGGKDQEQVEATNPNGTKTMVKVHSGDAVSVFSNFDLEYLGNRRDVTLPPPLPLTTEDLNIRTRFASGQAAIQVSENAEVVRAILLGVRTVGPDTPEMHARKKRLTDCVTDISDNTKLNEITEILGITPNIDDPNGTRTVIKTRIGELKLPELEGLENSDELKSCPQ